MDQSRIKFLSFSFDGKEPFFKYSNLSPEYEYVFEINEDEEEKKLYVDNNSDYFRVSKHQKRYKLLSYLKLKKTYSFNHINNFIFF